jgi:peptidoglycan/LPS O-acetylase OafA/YrhL
LAVVIVTVAYYARFLNVVNRIPDITYGLYLYHFPIAQTVIAHRVHEYSVPLAFVLIFAVTILVACLSRRYVER